MMFRGLLAAATAGAILAGCQSGGGTLTGEDYQAFYQPGLVNYAARGGYMPVAVYGEPFGPASPEIVANELRMPGGHVQVPFKASDTAQAAEDGRVVLIFGDGGPAAGGDKLCRMTAADVPPTNPGSGKLSVMAAFCHGTGLASEVHLSTARPATPSDPAFVNDMQIMLSRLLPTRDPNASSDCPGSMIGC